MSFNMPTNRTPNAGYPPTAHKAVTTGQQFDYPSQWIYVGGTGNLVLFDLFGDSVTYNTVPAGTIIWGQWTKVDTTSTTTGMVYAY